MMWERIMHLFGLWRQSETAADHDGDRNKREELHYAQQELDQARERVASLRDEARLLIRTGKRDATHRSAH